MSHRKDPKSKVLGFGTQRNQSKAQSGKNGETGAVTGTQVSFNRAEVQNRWAKIYKIQTGTNRTRLTRES